MNRLQAISLGSSSCKVFLFRQSIEYIIVDADSISNALIEQLGTAVARKNLVLFSTNKARLLALSQFNTFSLSRPIQFATPDIIRQGLSTLGGTISSSAILSGDIVTLEGLQRIPIGSILFSPSLVIDYCHAGKVPDYIITDTPSLKSVADRTHGGYIAEARSSRSDTIRRANYIASTLSDETGTKFALVSGGRYFPSKSDTRSTIDPLSNRILKNKAQEIDFSIISSSYQFMLQHAIQTPIGGIASVPPRPSKPYDRFSNIVQHLTEYFHCTNYSSSLRLLHDIPSQKNLSSFMRMQNAYGEYSFSSSVNGKNIVLIDDVITTGSTALSCARAIITKGAKSVTIVTLGINQFPNYWLNNSLYTPVCSKCGSALHVRINSKDHSYFYGCSSFPDCKNTCDQTIWTKQLLFNIDSYQLRNPPSPLNLR